MVINNILYRIRNVQLERCPNTSWREEDMTEWLRRRIIVFDLNTLKTELYNVVKLHKPQYKTFVIDQLDRLRHVTTCTILSQLTSN